jgi:transposase
MRPPYSARDLVRLYEKCDQVSFLDGHVRAFMSFGGVPVRIVYKYVPRNIFVTDHLRDAAEVPERALV